MDAGNHSDHPQLKPSVGLKGSANEGRTGPTVGLVDIGVSQASYLFRVAPPGIRKGGLKLDIESNGKVHIEGEIADNGILKNLSTVFKMKVQQLCPPEPISIAHLASPHSIPPITRHQGEYCTAISYGICVQTIFVFLLVFLSIFSKSLCPTSSEHSPIHCLS